ncbi:MAG: glycine betaine ABC transporter substrate-binding protein [Aminipila sp.]
MKKLVLILLSLVMVFSLSACGNKTEGTVVVGGKDFTEQDILVQLVSELIEANTDIKVVRKAYLGGSSIVAKSIETGDIDIYVEYTGTALMSVLNQEKMNDADAVYELVKKRYEEEKNIKWLEPLGFNNTFAITMKESRANELGIETLTDLGPKSKDFVFASTQEFLERPDGYDFFKQVYNVNFKEIKAMDAGLCYTAVKEDQADVNVSYATDGRIPAFGLKVLEDDQSFFPPYYAAPLVRMDTLEKYPELEEVLNSLAGKLTDEEMSNLNAKVDLEQRASKAVAKEWLQEQGLI